MFDSIKGLFGSSEPVKTPISGWPKIQYCIKLHFRGFLGLLSFLAVSYLLFGTSYVRNKVLGVYLLMVAYFLFQPVNIPMVGLIPVFALPMLGILDSDSTCKCYFNESIILLILGGMLHLILNNSGVERRTAIGFLEIAQSHTHSESSILVKACTAAFTMSIFSSRLMTTKTIAYYLTDPLRDLQKSTEKYRDNEANFDDVRHIMMMGVQTSAAIGSIAIMHGSAATIAFRAIWTEWGNADLLETEGGPEPPPVHLYPEAIFNYANYFTFSFPLAIILFIFNTIYFIVLMKMVIKKPITHASIEVLKQKLLEHKREIKKVMSTHELMTLFFASAIFFAFHLRTWPVKAEVPWVDDATVAAVFIILVHACPSRFRFLNYCGSLKRKDIPLSKPESGVLYWSFANKNTRYGYIILLGGGVAIAKVLKYSYYLDTIKLLEDTYLIGSLVVCAVAVVLCNIMPGVAGVICWLPAVLTFAPKNWNKYLPLLALGIGVAGSLCVMFPFLYTPAHHCHYMGRVPIKKMVKYSIGCLVIYTLVIWAAVFLYAPIVFNGAFTVINTTVPAPPKP